MHAPSDQYRLEDLSGADTNGAQPQRPKTQVIPPGDSDQILREQLEELIAHKRVCSASQCPRCDHYGLAQGLLLAIFV